MKLEKLIGEVMMGRGGKMTLPREPIQIPMNIVLMFQQTWSMSEKANREFGGNLVALWRSKTGLVQDRKIASIIPYGKLIDGEGAGNSVAIPDLGLEDNVGDFHTHPSDPSPHFPFDRRGYQPPSIEDVFALVSKAEKKVFVSFVVSQTTEIYAMLYLKGVFVPNAERLNVLKGKKDSKMTELVFPTQADKMKYFQESSKLKMDHTLEAKKAELKRKWELKTTGYGEKVAELGMHYLIKACTECSIGLYKGTDHLHRIC